MRITPPLWSLSNWSTAEHPDAALVGSRRLLRFSTSFHRYPARLRRGIDVVPQDIKNREFGSGRTRLEMLRSMGRSPKIGLATKLMDGIQAVQ